MEALDPDLPFDGVGRGARVRGRRGDRAGLNTH